MHVFFHNKQTLGQIFEPLYVEGGERRHNVKKHITSARCRRSASQYKIGRWWWSQNSPWRTQSSLPNHATMSWQMKIGSTMSDTWFNIIIMSSLPESYWSTLQTITASKHINKLSGSQVNGIKANDLIAFIIEEAQHHIINDEYTKNAEPALAAHEKDRKP